MIECKFYLMVGANGECVGSMDASDLDLTCFEADTPTRLVCVTVNVPTPKATEVLVNVPYED